MLAHAERAVLYADVVESVRLMDHDQDDFVERWLAIEADIRETILPRQGGRFVKGTGDGLLLEFESPQEAVAAAFAAHGLCRRANLNMPVERQIWLRIGVESGDIILGGTDVYGRMVNLAARLATLAGPLETVVSGNVRHGLVHSVDGDIVDLGECYLRHLTHPVRAFRIGAVGPRPAMIPADPMSRLKPTVAILPMQQRLGPPTDAPIGDIIAEEVIHHLARSEELHVISRLSTAAMRARPLTAAEIAVHLGADYVLSGTFSTHDTRLVFDAELCEARTERVVWSDRVSEDLGALFAVDQPVTERIAAQVASIVLLREIELGRGRPLPTLQGYTLLLSAIGLMHRLGRQDFEDARARLEALIERANRQAIPHAWMANWHLLNVFFGWSDNSERDTKLAQDHSRRALDADPENSQALTIDGCVNTHLLKRLDVAEDRYNEALSANPNNPMALLYMGTLHSYTDRGAKAVDYCERACRLSPLDPHRFFFETHLAAAYLTAGDHESAIKHASLSLRGNRNHASALRILAVAQSELGRREEARANAEELLRLEPHLTVSGYLARMPSASFEIGRRVARVLEEVGVPRS